MPKTPDQVDLTRASVSCNVCEDRGAPVIFQEDGVDHGDGSHHETGCYRVAACIGEISDDGEVVYAPPAEPDGEWIPILIIDEVAREYGPQCGIEVHPCPTDCQVRRSIEAHREHSLTHTQDEHNACAMGRAVKHEEIARQAADAGDADRYRVHMAAAAAMRRSIPTV